MWHCVCTKLSIHGLIGDLLIVERNVVNTLSEVKHAVKKIIRGLDDAERKNLCEDNVPSSILWFCGLDLNGRDCYARQRVLSK